MPRRTRALGLALSLSLCLSPVIPATAAPTLAPAQEAMIASAVKTVSKKTIENLNLRQSASASSKSLLVIPKNTTVKVSSTSNGWSKVSYNSKTGWVSSKFLTDASASSTVKTPTYRYLSSYQVLRQGASSTAKSLGALQRRTKVERLGTSGTWTKVKAGGKTGFVPTKQLASSIPAVSYRWTTSKQPIFVTASTKAAKATTVAAGAKVTWLRNSGSWSSVSVSGKTGWIQSKYLTSTAPLKVIGSRWTIGSTAVKNGTSTSAKSLGTIPAGQKLDLYSTSGSWSKVKTSKGIGWVPSSSLVSTTYKVIANKPYWAGASLSLKSGNSSSTKTLGTLAKGTKVTALGTANGWTRVKSSKGTGWVPSKNLLTKAPVIDKVIGSRWSIEKTVIRASASTTAKSVGTAAAGQKLSLYSTSGSWSKIKTSNGAGWVPTASLVTSAYTTVANKPSWTTAGTTLRSANNGSSKSLGSIAKGQKLTVIGTANGWSRVKTSKATGWVPTKSLTTKAPVVDKVIGTRWSLDAVAVRASASATAKSLGTIPAGEKLSLYATSGSFSKVKTSKGTGWVATSTLSSSAYTVIANKSYWATTFVNQRAGNSVSTKTLGVLSKNEKVTAVGSSNGWIRVKSRFGTGWVSGAYLSVSQPSLPLPTTPPAPAPDASYRWTTANVNLRTGAGTQYGSKGVVALGEKVTYLKTSNGWANVVTSLGSGWISDDYLSTKATVSVQPDTQKVIDAVKDRFAASISTIYTLRSGSVGHSSGKAADLMIKNYKTAAGVANGDKIAQFLLDNRNQLGISYLIWQDEIWLPTTGWTAYSTSGKYGNQFTGNWNDTTRHMDHIHVEVYGNSANNKPLDLSSLK
ncbi:SH3 domain-containing protein [Glutamicibacter sp. NPDC087344]|uniref:SH3 domain-containing protein n=1 Tax=Glutamicibacter sp. NPDC087344 TaxID=3363994 RepID=UPI0037F4B08C